MEDILKQLINTLYEAEGLTEMALRRKVCAEDRLINHILRKCDEIGQIAITMSQEQKAQIDAQWAVKGEEEKKEEASTKTEDVLKDDDEIIEEEKEVEVFTDEILPQIAETQKLGDISDASIFEQELQENQELVDDPKSEIGERKPVIGRLSINDKHRFRRELFGGDDARMRQEFEVIEEKDTISDIESYVYQELGWDPEQREVKELLQRIENNLRKR